MFLQFVLLCPALYYKSKLCVHNFIVHDLESKHCVCYVWNEWEGDLTANELATDVVWIFCRLPCLQLSMSYILMDEAIKIEMLQLLLAFLFLT